ncbi:DASH complex subunit DUO1 [Sporobolomyces koalae]|uniref:DASH complex subunit DUO1 n=1 Tax=Sporobolomyces koalae TaxID=500713 RepID=UPI0031774BD7
MSFQDEFGDLSIASTTHPHQHHDNDRDSTDRRPRERYSVGGLLQDEDLSFGPGQDDDSFGFDTTEQATIKVGPNRSNEQTRTSSMMTKRDPSAFEFGGSMASSAHTGSGPSGSTTTHVHDDERQERAGPVPEEQEEEEDATLVPGFESFSPEDQQRIKHLQAERSELRGMNRVLQGVIKSLNLTETNISKLAASANTSHDLLDLYSRISSQAEHSKDLILDPEWKGLEADEEFLANRQQAIEREQERIRIEAEEQERLELEQARDAEERKKREQEELEHRRKVTSSGTGARGSSVRGTRGASTVGGAGGRVLVRGTRARPTTISTRGSGIQRPTATSSASPSTSSSSFSSASGIPTFNGGTTTGRGSAHVSGVRGVRGLRSRGSGIGRGRGASTT